MIKCTSFSQGIFMTGAEIFNFAQTRLVIYIFSEQYTAF